MEPPDYDREHYEWFPRISGTNNEERVHPVVQCTQLLGVWWQTWIPVPSAKVHVHHYWLLFPKEGADPLVHSKREICLNTLSTTRISIRGRKTSLVTGTNKLLMRWVQKTKSTFLTISYVLTRKSNSGIKGGTTWHPCRASWKTRNWSRFKTYSKHAVK